MTRCECMGGTTACIYRGATAEPSDDQAAWMARWQSSPAVTEDKARRAKEAAAKGAKR